MVLVYELHCRERNSQQCCAIHINELCTGVLNSVYSLSGTCRQKLVQGGID